MGVITPPVGLNVYVVYGVARNIMDDITLESIFRGIVPFLIAVVAGIVILMIFPQIVLYLPNLMY
jgi:TRAP-type C4-dicarboxylate transport system permease large subunit